jgi:ketosteroid isomerase-like protein
MRTTRQLLSVLPLLLAGCATVSTTDLSASYPAEQAQIRRRLDEIFDAVRKKDLDRLDSYHFYGPKFTKFAAESPARLGAADARKGEHDGLAAINDLSTRADDLKIDVFGGAGIATFVLNYSFRAGTNTFEKQARGTLVFVKDHGAWKITHEHFSLAKTAP